MIDEWVGGRMDGLMKLMVTLIFSFHMSQHKLAFFNPQTVEVQVLSRIGYLHRNKVNWLCEVENKRVEKYQQPLKRVI